MSRFSGLSKNARIGYECLSKFVPDKCLLKKKQVMAG